MILCVGGGYVIMYVGPTLQVTASQHFKTLIKPFRIQLIQLELLENLVRNE